MSREAILDHWLAEILQGAPYQRVAMTNDASFRRYFRIFVDKGPFVLMDAPPPENPFLFKDIALILKTQSLSVPDIFASHPSGLLLLSDFGDRVYLKELNTNTAPILYEDAFDALIKLHQCKAQVPVFNQAFLERQWGIFKEWFLDKHLQLEITPRMDALLNSIFTTLKQVISEQPFVFVHRDYHSRNLMLLDKDNPGILDFQDAMRGPITYDLVSLLQDCYIGWPRTEVEDWVRKFKLLIERAGLLTKQVNQSQFLRWFDLTGVQRHLKNLGIFSRLFYRDGKPQYLKDMAKPFNYVLQACSRYEQLKSLGEFLEPFSSQVNQVNIEKDRMDIEKSMMHLETDKANTRCAP